MSYLSKGELHLQRINLMLVPFDPKQFAFVSRHGPEQVNEHEYSRAVQWAVQWAVQYNE